MGQLEILDAEPRDERRAGRELMQQRAADGEGETTGRDEATEVRPPCDRGIRVEGLRIEASTELEDLSLAHSVLAARHRETQHVVFVVERLESGRFSHVHPRARFDERSVAF